MTANRAEENVAAVRGQLSNNHIWALKDVFFEVKCGEVAGIPSASLRTGSGRNGAGKTTLLKILSRITEPSEGKEKKGLQLLNRLEQ